MGGKPLASKAAAPCSAVNERAASGRSPGPWAVSDRRAGATTERLERWAERVPDAHKLDDVFAQN